MGARQAAALLLGAIALAFTSAAAAKDFDPGDLIVCNAKGCVPITDQQVLKVLSTFYYGETRLTTVARPRLRSPFFQLRFSNGYVTGIVGPTSLDRFLSYGVNLGRYPRGQSRQEKFSKAGLVKVFCDIHSHMSASILVLDHPYFTIPGTDGNYEIKNVPAGQYTIVGWHERVGERSASLRVEAGRPATVDLTVPVEDLP